MSPNKPYRSRVKVTEVQEFLRDPPPGFFVEPLEGDSCGYRVHSDPETNLVLIDDCDSFCRGRIVFQNSLGRKVKMHNLWEYTSLRKSLLSKRIHLLTSACKYDCDTNNNNNRLTDELEVVNQYVVSVDGSDALMKWQMARGLDWTISSVAGESYTVEIDLTEALQSWTNSHIFTDKVKKAEPVWRDASFTLKYHSDALFDFPYWFGFSKRSFKSNRVIDIMLWKRPGSGERPDFVLQPGEVVQILPELRKCWDVRKH